MSKSAVRLLLENQRYALMFLMGVALGVGATSVVLTHWLHLNPCYLCITQRILVFVLVLGFGTSALIARGGRQLTLLVCALISLCGIAAAAFQSWEQWYPAQLSCSSGKPNVLERLVDWIGGLWPSMFMATGICSDKELEIFGLSLANWSFVVFSGFATAALALLIGNRYWRNR
jgi:protein dithiol:quinone oxidoreductase